MKWNDSLHLVQFCLQGHHTGILESAVVRMFKPQESEEKLIPLDWIDCYVDFLDVTMINKGGHLP